MYYCFQIIALSGFGGFIFHKFIQTVFPYFGWSSCISLSLCRDDKSLIPLGNFSGPSFWALCSNSESWRHINILCLDPVWDAVCQEFLSPSFEILCMFSNPVF